MKLDANLKGMDLISNLSCNSKRFPFFAKYSNFAKTLNLTAFLLFYRVIILAVVLAIFEYDNSIHCIDLLWFYKIGYFCILVGK